jgi:DNA-binding transcriptional MerR regulator
MVDKPVLSQAGHAGKGSYPMWTVFRCRQAIPAPSGGDKIARRTIDQLARYAGVTSETILVYHAEGLLSEAEPNHEGQGRYTDRHAAQLLTVRTLVEAGVTAAGIRNLAAASGENLASVLADLDVSLGARIQGLQQTQRRLRRAATGRRPPQLPSEVTDALRRLPELGFSARWTAAETDLWVQVFGALDNAADLFRVRMASFDDPDVRQQYLDYDRVLDLEPSGTLAGPGGPLVASGPNLKNTLDGLANRLRLLRDTRRRLRRLDPGQIKMLPSGPEAP